MIPLDFTVLDLRQALIGAAVIVAMAALLITDRRRTRQARAACIRRHPSSQPIRIPGPRRHQ